MKLIDYIRTEDGTLINPNHIVKISFTETASKYTPVRYFFKVWATIDCLDQPIKADKNTYEDVLLCGFSSDQECCDCDVNGRVISRRRFTESTYHDLRDYLRNNARNIIDYYTIVPDWARKQEASI